MTDRPPLFPSRRQDPVEIDLRIDDAYRDGDLEFAIYAGLPLKVVAELRVLASRACGAAVVLGIDGALTRAVLPAEVGASLQLRAEGPTAPRGQRLPYVLSIEVCVGRRPFRRECTITVLGLH